MGAVGLLSFVGGVAESLVLVLLTLTADSLIRDESGIELASRSLDRQTAVLVALGLVCVRVGTIMWASRVSAVFASGVIRRAQGATLAAYLHSSYVSRSARSIGEVSTVVVTHGRFCGDLAGSFAMVAASICGLLAFGGTSFVVNPLATAGIALIGLVVLALMQPLRKRTHALSRSFSGWSRNAGQEVTEIEQLHREIELFRVADSVESTFGDHMAVGADRYRQLRFLGTAIPQLFQAAMLTAAVVSLLVIVQAASSADLAAVGAVVLLLIRSMSSAQQYVNANQRVIEQGSYAEGVNHLISDLSMDRRKFGNEKPEHLTPLTLSGVGFSYDGSTSVLEDIDLRLEEGELIGIVGPSGAGKSTLVELLLRLRPTTTGTIDGAGTEWDKIDPGEFSGRVAFVPQQAVLISGTVAENVDLFRGLPEDQIRDAIKQAHLESEIAALPEGMHTRLGPDSRSLSGGQRQRLTIARALAGNPEILILDEPTSALDALSEAAIRQTLEELPHGRLVLVVAHRFSTLRSCSRIIALKAGRVEVDADPEEVARRSEFFRAMVNEGG